MRNAYRLNVIADHDRKIIIFRVIGPMPSVEFAERLFETYEAMEAPWTYSRIMDFRRFEGLVDFAVVEDIARRWAALCAGRMIHSRVAVISLDALDRARVPAASPMFPNETICHFSDYHEAMAWITSPDTGPAAKRSA